ncbi:hypothetical protein [Sedimenticola selenatireducens]|uniref:Uncharacterized protein n=1 Tax=Sedimenticola selenatireducens TaxID=191960 RepID=A0A557SCH9_9GAMM|nr:hypothetical protein [Sedimenticola selenatireducens]TVO75117.1 hypothetical protein FHP88_08880 [Sedimenticola selenatireducens]TVT67028.1 MAG: hypothetical protein FHK78_01475 [Sedimenticola selenatireducens]
MAMKPCRECKKIISTKADTCPYCGSKTKNGHWLYLIIIGFIILIFFSLYKGIKSTTRATRPNNPTQHQNTDITKPPVFDDTKILGLNWFYNETEDPLGRGVIKRATVKSINTVSFDFPYRGEQRATLQLRDHPKYGKDVLFYIEKGQFTCRINKCTVNVRFGDEKPKTFTALEPQDQSTTLLFIQKYNDFVAKIMKVNRVQIEATFYQNGNHVFEFDTKNLIWP